MRKAFLFWLYCGILAGSMLLADQITFKNGDRLTGKIVRADGQNLVLKADFAGEVTIPLAAIDRIVSDQPLFLTLADGQVIHGAVDTTATGLALTTKDAGVVNVNRETVQTIRSEAEQAAYQAALDRLANPGLLDLWTGFMDTGISLAEGNTKSFNFALGARATRATTNDRTVFYVSSLYGRNTVAGDSVTTADKIQGGGRYEINLTKRLFAFGTGDLEYDKIQELDLRMVLGGGLGWYIRRDDRTQFQVFGGGALNKEYYMDGFHRTSGELLFGEEYNTALSKTFSFNERLTVFPNLSETGEYRLNFDASAVANLNRWLGWQISLGDRYLSNPPLGNKSNDVLLTTGLRFTFAR